MADFIFIMWKPLVACLILTGVHTYLGIHVIERKVIFVDLALAQIAALGASGAFLFGCSFDSSDAYGMSLAAAFAGAVIFSATRMRREKIPQEAIIGIVYAVSSAAAILILSKMPEGDEGIRHMLVGNILLVSLPELVKMTGLYLLVGLFHWYFRKVLILISADPEEAFRRKISVRKWDLAFYVTFGLVVTSSVHIAGVLLVFSFLIVPAVCAILCSNRLETRLLIGWAVGAGISGASIWISYFLDLPTGPTVICLFGLVLIVFALVRRIFV
ncbi:MAG TPA: metal ABC transporter permease [Candidatus Omnitrophota bacterium]|nr:metal ABC transporter permease [Candidatus Omnitrophota bacterium]